MSTCLGLPHRLVLYRKRLPLGLASSYSESYPSDLVGVLGEEEWHDIITRFNHTLLTYWPCDLCFFVGIFCAPCSLGLSLIAPTRCLTEVEEQANEFLYRVSNRPNFYDKKICFSLEHDWCRRILVITFPDHFYPEVLPLDTEISNHIHQLLLQS